MALPLVTVFVAIACGGSVATPGSGEDRSDDARGAPKAPSPSTPPALRETCTAIPVCEGNDLPITDPIGCPPNAGCYSRELCDQKIWCRPVGGCAPACPVGYTLASSCPEDAGCVPIKGCGSVWILCKPCAKPACEPGDHEVASASECPQDDVRCYEVKSACPDIRTWCWGAPKDGGL